MKSPNIDTRNYEDILNELVKKAPNYVPEWRISPENPDAGTALSIIFAHMFEETIDRYNQVPYKNFVAFLNMLGAKFKSVSAAKGFVTFKTSDGAPSGVLVKKEKQLFAQSGDEKLIFETLEDLFVTPAEIIKMFTVDPVLDRIVENKNFSNLENYKYTNIPMFNTINYDNLQSHILFLGSKNVMNLVSQSIIELEIIILRDMSLAKHLAQKLIKNSSWSYFSQGEWINFDEVSFEQNKIFLKKEKLYQIDEIEVNEKMNRWIKCEVENLNEIVNSSFNKIIISSNVIGESIPEKLFARDLEVKKTNFYPFGERFSLYDCFYIGSTEVFSKKGAICSVSFTLDYLKKELEITMPQTDIKWKLIMDKSAFREPEEHPIKIVELSWEYWNGIGWTKLFINDEYDGILAEPICKTVKIEFKIPDDIEPAYINSINNLWIRARIIKIENQFVVYGYFLTPFFEKISLDYRYNEREEVENYISENNMEVIERAVLSNVNKKDIINEEFNPFSKFDVENKTIYFGFDKPPIGGPISVFFVLSTILKDNPSIKWEYFQSGLGDGNWCPLKVLDRTNSFANSGLVSFVGPDDFSKNKIFNEELYWIRVVNIDGRYDDNKIENPKIEGIYINTTETSHQETMEKEMFGMKTVEKNKNIKLSKEPVLNEEVWINEFGEIRDEEVNYFIEEKIHEVNKVFDECGVIKEIWIKWNKVNDITLESSNSRVYEIDDNNGLITFGDDINGKVPNISDNENIEIRYKVGGGKKGNVGKMQLNSIAGAIAFIDKVYNVLPTAGGFDRQQLNDALIESIRTIKHQNRAVTKEDFEWLAFESTNEVVKTKCLKNTNIFGKKEYGSITVVILPDNYKNREGYYSLVLKNKVEKYLRERASITLTQENSIRVIEPVYIKISVIVNVRVASINHVAYVENLCKEKFDKFIDPLTGNVNGNGWDIGEMPHISKFHSILKSIDQINFIDKVVISAVKEENGIIEDVNIEDSANLPHAIAISGDHKIDIYIGE